MNNNAIISQKDIENLIYTVRGKQVMVDKDLAALYQVETKILNKAVKRNIERFPETFCFQLDDEESETLRFQIGTSSFQLPFQSVESRTKQENARYSVLRLC